MEISLTNWQILVEYNVYQMGCLRCVNNFVDYFLKAEYYILNLTVKDNRRKG